MNNHIFLSIILQTSAQDRKKMIKQAIKRLFKLSTPITSSDADKAKLKEIQMAYGILLKRSGLMSLTMIDDKIKDTERELDNPSKVTNIHHVQYFNLTTSPHTLLLSANFCTTVSPTEWSLLMVIHCRTKKAVMQRE